MVKRTRDIPTPNEVAGYPSPGKRTVAIDTTAEFDLLKKRDTAIKKMSYAMLETGMFTPEAIEVLKAGRISDRKIKESIDQAKRDMHPDPHEVDAKYALGFAFNYDRTHVLLVWKNRPRWQNGLLNGIGGKIEANEFPFAAMKREFYEETGLDSEMHGIDWVYVGKKHRAAMYDNQPGSYALHMFAAYMPLQVMKNAQAHVTDEEVICLPMNLEILRRRGVPGLPTTVGLALESLQQSTHVDVEEPPFLEEDGE
jgi:8-oxo-dGTP diphosphatase